ncbi:hypothetical protein F5Y03DRAFT_363610 [Xylaria venustula]|nr:hypothetical protein F5Y03DRAFT_363610 [Xylaria venustula]
MRMKASIGCRWFLAFLPSSAGTSWALRGILGGVDCRRLGDQRLAIGNWRATQPEHNVTAYTIHRAAFVNKVSTDVQKRKRLDQQSRTLVALHGYILDRQLSASGLLWSV